MGPGEGQPNGPDPADAAGKAARDASSKKDPMSAARARSAAPRPGPTRQRRPAAGTPDRALQDLWVERLRAGDAEALRDVVQAFGERLTAVVAGVLRDRDAVQDVVQEFVSSSTNYTGFKSTEISGTGPQ